MKKALDKIKEAIFGHVGIFITLLCVVPFFSSATVSSGILRQSRYLLIQRKKI